MLKKIFILLFASIIFSGCTQKNNKEVLTFSSWGSATECAIIKNIIKNFESENPNIKINFIHVPQNYFQKIHLLFASNTAPDIVFINNLYLPIYETYLEDLNNIIDKNEFYTQSIESLSINKKLLAVPRDISNLVFYVNTDKTDLPNSNWTLQDLITIAKKNTTPDFWGISYEDNIYWALPYLNYFGGGVLDKNLNLIIENKESQKALNFYNNLKNKYKVAPNKSQVGSSTLAQMFLEEKIVMYLSGRWLYPKISQTAKFNWAIINFPNSPNGQLCDVSGWAISKNSKHKNSAIKFVQYLSSQKNIEYFSKTGLIIPARKDCKNFITTKNHNEKVFFDIISVSKKTPVNKDYKRITDSINNKYF